MKGSAVSQSFRVLASKINNQAPLGQRESNRLLNALTSSFRKHLDEVHPSRLHEDSKRPVVKDGPEATHRHAFPSSITLADQHMASVLTNPLLVKTAASQAHPKPELDAGTAAAELKDGANPFELLEKYHAKGYATVDVALSCMKAFRRSIKELTYEEQVSKVQEQEAGKRLLTWLWNSDILQSQAFADSLQIQDGLVWLVMMEGHEDFLWKWLETDLELPQSLMVKGHQDSRNNGHFWKSRIIYAMVMTNLGPPHKGARSADAALEVYFRAVQHVQQRKNTGVRDRMVLVARARLALEKALTHGSGHHYSNTNAALYDKFVKIYANHQLSHTYNAQKYAMDEFHRAQLDLWHPTRPSADIWYELVTREIPASDGVAGVRELLQNPKTSNDTAHYIKTFARAARLMKTAGKHAESTQLVTAAQIYFPDKISQVTEAMQDLLTDERHSEQRDKKTQKEQHEHQHQDNWLSQYFPAPT
jgi:hypothetical protein